MLSWLRVEAVSRSDTHQGRKVGSVRPTNHAPGGCDRNRGEKIREETRLCTDDTSPEGRGGSSLVCMEGRTPATPLSDGQRSPSRRCRRNTVRLQKTVIRVARENKCQRERRWRQAHPKRRKRANWKVRARSVRTRARTAGPLEVQETTTSNPDCPFVAKPRTKEKSHPLHRIANYLPIAQAHLLVRPRAAVDTQFFRTDRQERPCKILSCFQQTNTLTQKKSTTCFRLARRLLVARRPQHCFRPLDATYAARSVCGAPRCRSGPWANRFSHGNTGVSWIQEFLSVLLTHAKCKGLSSIHGGRWMAHVRRPIHSKGRPNRRSPLLGSLVPVAAVARVQDGAVGAQLRL